MRSATVVVVITLLIWFVADQGVMTDDSVSVPVVFSSQNPEVYVGLTQPPAQREYKVNIRGRRRRITELKALLAVRESLEIRMDEARAPRIEPYQLSVRDDLLRNLRTLRITGSILKATPAEESIRIDSYVEIDDIPVRVEFGDLKVSRTLSDKTVSARVPAFVAANETFRSNLEAVINGMDYMPDSERTPGSSFEFQGKPTLSGLSKLFVSGNAIQLTPPSIAVSGKIETLQIIDSKGPITIRWSIPDQVQKEYRIVAEDAEFIIYVDVSGPRERVAALEANQIRAYVDIFARDTNETGKTITREVRYFLPIEFAGCRVSEETAKRQVRFRLEPIATDDSDAPTTEEPDGES